MKKTRHHKQKLYKMRGCSLKNCSHKGGKGVVLVGDITNDLAYPYTGKTVINPNLAYTGKGGNKCATNFSPSNLAYTGKGGYKCPPNTTDSNNSNLGIVTTSNVNGVNPLYPNTGPPFNGFNFLNPITNQRGGNCSSSCAVNMNGMSGGNSHRNNCRCSTCKMNGGNSHKSDCNCDKCTSSHKSDCNCSKCNMNGLKLITGGGGCSTSNGGIPYPDGLVGKPYVNPTNLPGANHIPGDANYYSLNTYINDVSRQMLDIGANRPFLGFFKGGKRIKRIKKSNNKTRKMKGGTLSNFLGQDLINLGRQFTFGVGSAYNALNGYSAPTNPLPWKGQLPNSANLNTIRNL